MSSAGVFALKVVATPLLVGAASLAGRRWGSAIAGWLVGIPFTSAPVAFFFALDQGSSFAAAAAVGIMAGAASQAVFCVAYAWTAHRVGWATSVLSGCAAFAVATVLLDRVELSSWVTFIAMIAVLMTSLWLMPAQARPSTEGSAYPRWDIPARMVVATAFVIALTALAPQLGPRLAGLLAPFPLYAAVLAVFAHRLEGAVQAVGVLRGLLVGLFAFETFFLILAQLLVPFGIATAFAAAIIAALAIQAGSLFLGRRAGIA